MAQSRHGRSGGRPSPGSGLPTWAQRHLEEAGDTAVIPVTPASPARRQHRAAGPAPSGLRGWGVAIVSVAAAVGAVPLAVSSVANNHTDDPLPKVDTYTASRPGPLQTDPGGTRSGPTSAPQQDDQATSGVLEEPAEPPVARAPVVPRRTVQVPVPAAVVRTTRAAVTPVVPATPRAATSTAPTTTTTETSTPKSAPKPPKSAPKPAPTSDDGDDGGSQQSGGLIGNTVGTLDNAVGGVVGAL